MTVSGIEALSTFSALGGGTPYGGSTEAAGAGAGIFGTPRTAGAEGPAGPSFGRLLAGSIEGLEGMQDRTDGLSVQAATGDLAAIHEYTVAATETKVATELTVAVRNKAVEAFTEILRMQV